MVKGRGQGTPKHASREEDVRKLIAVSSASALFMLGPAAPLAGASHNKKPHPGPNRQQQQQQQQQSQSQTVCLVVILGSCPAP
jgi:hypothetical protein